MKVPFVDLKPQFREVEHEVLPMVREAMEDADFIGGPQVTGFEVEFGAFCDSKYCVGVNSGTDALRFALIAAGVGPGDEVITVPHTFIATTEAISQVGAKPVFVDIDLQTYNMDVSKIAGAITPRTRAIVPVHIYGQPADMDPILGIAHKNNLVVIEDACQAHGALYKGKRAGSMGLIRVLQLLPGKEPWGLWRSRRCGHPERRDGRQDPHDPRSRPKPKNTTTTWKATTGGSTPYRQGCCASSSEDWKRGTRQGGGMPDTTTNSSRVSKESPFRWSLMGAGMCTTYT